MYWNSGAQFFLTSARTNSLNRCSWIIIPSDGKPNMPIIRDASMGDINTEPLGFIDISADIHPGVASEVRGVLSKKIPTDIARWDICSSAKAQHDVTMVLANTGFHGKRLHRGRCKIGYSGLIGYGVADGTGQLQNRVQVCLFRKWFLKIDQHFWGGKGKPRLLQ